jgi:hypothetical protein
VNFHWLALEDGQEINHCFTSLQKVALVSDLTMPTHETDSEWKQHQSLVRLEAHTVTSKSIRCKLPRIAS